MSSCPNCGSTDIDNDSSRGDSACMQCGTIMQQNAIVSEVGFVEGANGASSVLGQFVSSTGGARLSASAKTRGPGGRGPSVGYQKDSREHTIQNGRKAIQQVADHLRLRPHHVDSAVRLFMLAVQHNFIQGRRTAHVVAACLYIVCRREKTPHLLIDFSDVLQINLYVLGATFLKFVRLLNLSLPIIDPSLYIHRFAAQLELRDAENRDKTHMVAMTALRLVARMKRDWMLVGRRPSGICGACLLIAARIHGFKRTQKEIIYIVKICDMTLRKRLLEFSNTSSSQLTLEQFEAMDVELITNSRALVAQENAEARARDPLAETKADPFGIEQDPPAFTRNRVKEREEKNILAQKLKLQQNKELLLKELELDTQPKLNARLMPGGGKSSGAAAAAGGQQLLLPAGSDDTSARDLEIQQIQSESRLLLESQPAVSDSIVHQIEELMEQKTGFSMLDEGPQREVSSLGKDSAHVHVTPLDAPLHGAAAAAASSSSAAAAASPATPAVPTPIKERLKSIHKGPNLSSSRSRRGAGGPGQPPSTPLQSILNVSKDKDAPPFDLASILPAPALPGSLAAAASVDMLAMQQFASVGNPLADAMLVAADPSLHLSTVSSSSTLAAVAAAASSSSAAAAAGAHVTVSAYLAATPVDPDLNNWSDLAELDEEIESSVLLSAEETAFKTAAWEQIHRDYLAEQEEKKLLAAQQGANGAPLGPDGLPLPRRQYKKKPKGGAPAATAAEATMRLLAEKKYSDKINYNALKGLLSNEIDKPKPKVDEEEEDDDDDDEEDEDEEEAASVGSKRGVSSISAQLPSAKQQRTATSASKPSAAAAAADDDDDGDDDAGDDAEDGAGGDEDDEPASSRRGRGNDDDDEAAEEEDYE